MTIQTFSERHGFAPTVEAASDDHLPGHVRSGFANRLREFIEDRDAVVSDALGKEPFSSGMHTTLRVAIEKLYAYRGDLGGVAHGQVGPSQVGIEEAEWALTTALAAVLYLVKKFGHLRE